MKSVAILTAALLAAPALAQEAAMPSDGEIAQILSDRIGRDQANVGIAVAVIENGETRFVSHGTLTLDGAEPITEHTIFEAGSITKVFTNLALAQLVNDRKIELDAPIINYLPEGFVLPDAPGRAITAFDLATHSASLSGLPPDLLAGETDNPYSGYGVEGLQAWLADYTLPRPVGESFEYNNAGTTLLGLAIAHVSGTDFSNVISENILAPLGMTETSLELTGTAPPEALASGHNGAREPTSNWDFDAFAPAGALLTSSSDLIKFIGAASGQIPSELEPAINTMLARTRPVEEGTSIGLGWFITTTGQGEIVWHNGMTGGYSSFAGFDRTSGNGVVVLTNMAAQLGVNDIGMHILNPAIPLNEQPRLRTSVEIDPALFDDYVGEYVLAPGAVITVTTQDGKLFAQLTGQDAFEIFPESETQFFYKVTDAQITFDVNNGDVKSLILHQNGQNIPALKLVE
ncbi:serine hydrolase [Devosia sp. XK-2]|uniref:serine hydrolase n=1 Tax=Devosia sp. XK-2 TaxID=3126689 RepID=UPI0030D5B87C